MAVTIHTMAKRYAYQYFITYLPILFKFTSPLRHPKRSIFYIIGKFRKLSYDIKKHRGYYHGALRQTLQILCKSITSFIPIPKLPWGSTLPSPTASLLLHQIFVSSIEVIKIIFACNVPLVVKFIIFFTSLSFIFDFGLLIFNHSWKYLSRCIL